MHGFVATVVFDAGGKVWRVQSHWPLFDLELMLGRRLPLTFCDQLEFQGVGISITDSGFLLRVQHPASGGVVELDQSHWCFPAWLNHLERSGISRAHVLQDAGIQALEWREKYLEWAVAEELAHIEQLVTEGGKTFDEIFAWGPAVAGREDVQLLRGRLENEGRAPKRKRGQRGKDHALWVAKRELGLLALDLLQSDSSGCDDLMTACRIACQLRHDWVPRRWSGQDGPARYLYDAIRKDFKGTVFDSR